VLKSTSTVWWNHQLHATNDGGHEQSIVVVARLCALDNLALNKKNLLFRPHLHNPSGETPPTRFA
jgi:hypothetical protein